MTLVVIGAGGHSRPVIDAALEMGMEIRGVVDLNYHGQSEQILGCDVIGETGLDGDETKHAVLAIGDNRQRREWFERLRAAGWSFPNVIHPRSTVSSHCDLGVGVFVNAGAIVNAGVRLGDNSVVNTGAIVDHDCIIGAHSHLGPGVCLAGRVTIGCETFVGIGASIIQCLTVGERVTVGAGAAIISDVADGQTIVGVPGRVLSV